MPKVKCYPDKDELHKLLLYNLNTGQLVWKKRTAAMFTATDARNADHACAQWNSRFAGKEALTKVNLGYRCGRLNYQYVLAHRVIWKWMTGEEAKEVDHIDGNRSNNAWNNLRSVTASLNRRNASIRADNTSGVTGVTYVKRRDRWQAGMNIAGKYVYLGLFTSKEEAVLARKVAERKYGFHPNHGRDNSNPAA
jgi:hypothetical protein